MNLGQLISRNARYHGDAPAVTASGIQCTHAEWNARVNRLANAMLAHGVGKGQAVATMLPNCIELLEVYWAAAKTGAIVVPLSPLLAGPGLASLLADAEAALLFTERSLIPVVEAARAHCPGTRYVLTDGIADGYLAPMLDAASFSPAEPPTAGTVEDDLYNIMYTSGTTGMPKGIMLSHGIRARYGALMAAAFRIGPESVILQTGSLVFNGAFVTMLPAFYMGARYLLHPAFDAAALIETVARERVSHIMLVPSQIIAVLSAPNFDPAKLASLKMILSLGAPLHARHKETLQSLLPGRFHELYGLTEGFLTILDHHDAQRKAGSVGVPLPFSEMKILKEDGSVAAVREVGEICGHSPLLMRGYFKRPDLTAAAIPDGWLRSGDLGYVDEYGYLYLVDRKKDMIDSGGVKVYPRDIEELVIRHPAVKEAAVFGIPHEKWGETPLAAVELKQAGSIDAASLKQWINAQVSAKYQRVHEVLIMDAFPRNTAGKVLKREMRDVYWQGQTSKI